MYRSLSIICEASHVDVNPFRAPVMTTHGWSVANLQGIGAIKVLGIDKEGVVPQYWVRVTELGYKLNGW